MVKDENEYNRQSRNDKAFRRLTTRKFQKHCGFRVLFFLDIEQMFISAFNV